MVPALITEVWLAAQLILTLKVPVLIPKVSVPEVAPKVMVAVPVPECCTVPEIRLIEPDIVKLGEPPAVAKLKVPPATFMLPAIL